MLVVEDNGQGGLGDAVRSALTDAQLSDTVCSPSAKPITHTFENKGLCIRSLCVEFPDEHQSYAQTLANFGLDASGIEQAVQFLHSVRYGKRVQDPIPFRGLGIFKYSAHRTVSLELPDQRREIYRLRVSFSRQVSRTCIAFR